MVINIIIVRTTLSIMIEEHKIDDIKDHDRELVRQVCEKIYNDLKPHYGEEINAVVIERVLSNLQKEYEK